MTIHRANGRTFPARARLVNGRWVTARTQMRKGDTATIKPGAVVDAFGERNGASMQVTA